MKLIGIPSVLLLIFLAYVAHSIWTITQIFSNLKCTGRPCYQYVLNSKPPLQMAIFTSVKENPIHTEVTKVCHVEDFNYSNEFIHEYKIKIPRNIRLNGNLYAHIILASKGDPLIEWKTLRRSKLSVKLSIKLTENMQETAETFHLLEGPSSSLQIEQAAPRPVAHILIKVQVVMLTDDISISTNEMYPELMPLVHLNQEHKILPIIKADYFNKRLSDYTKISKNMSDVTITFRYAPISIGKLRLMRMMEHGMETVKKLGFSDKDIDEVKGIFSDTNVYLLCGTMFIASIHMILDFLSIKNDIDFWRRKESYEGISARTTIWRAFSQVVIFLNLYDEQASRLVLIPCLCGVFIEIWKCKRILKMSFPFRPGNKRNQPYPNNTEIQKAELKTEEFDRQGMRYLSYLLYPLCISGAIYSLIYHSFKTWYSWILSSLVNGVYAFGFLFMLPQLYVNYKMKSVAALPWRAFMYKAFNTFIDDIFAFIIVMPTAHRVACFRDDIVFIIYLYQRWLYPVDQTRSDVASSTQSAIDFDDSKDESYTETKKYK